MQYVSVLRTSRHLYDLTILFIKFMLFLFINE